jgi:hypothetical protein
MGPPSDREKVSSRLPLVPPAPPRGGERERERPPPPPLRRLLGEGERLREREPERDLDLSRRRGERRCNHQKRQFEGENLREKTYVVSSVVAFPMVTPASCCRQGCQRRYTKTT